MYVIWKNFRLIETNMKSDVTKVSDRSTPFPSHNYVVRWDVWMFLTELVIDTNMKTDVKKMFNRRASFPYHNYVVWWNIWIFLTGLFNFTSLLNFISSNKNGILLHGLYWQIHIFNHYHYNNNIVVIQLSFCCYYNRNNKSDINIERVLIARINY